MPRPPTGIQRVDRGRNHWYKIDGQRADGVTTLLKEGLPRKALTYWAARTVAEAVADMSPADLDVLRRLGRDGMVDALKAAPWKRRDDAALRGTDVHLLAEQLITGAQVEVPDELAGHVEACLKFLEEWNVRPVVTEAVIAHRKWAYAGTLDAVVDLNHPQLGEQRALLDYKTSSGVYADTAFQLAAYRWAETYLDTNGAERDMADLRIEDAYVVHLRADGYDVYPVVTNEAVFRHYLHVIWVARHCVGDEVKELLGAAIDPPRRTLRAVS